MERVGHLKKECWWTSALMYFPLHIWSLHIMVFYLFEVLHMVSQHKVPQRHEVAVAAILNVHWKVKVIMIISCW